MRAVPGDYKAAFDKARSAGMERYLGHLQAAPPGGAKPAAATGAANSPAEQA